MSKNIKDIGLVSALTMASRVLGQMRETLTATVFGTSVLMSAFVTGVTLPNLFRRLLAEGGMTAAFVPTLNDELHARQRTGAFQLVNQVTSWLLAATVAIVAAAMLLFSQEALIMRIGAACRAGPDTIERWLMAGRFAVILFPYLVFVSLAAAFSAALQSLQRFLEPALSPIWLNLSIIGSLALAWLSARGDPTKQIQWLAAGWLVGGFFQMAVPARALMREGWRPRIDFTLSGPMRAMVRLMVPTLFGSSVYLANMSVSRLVGLSLNDEAVAVLNYAQRLMELPIGVFAIAVATVVFPLISRYAAAGDDANLALAYRKGMRLILVINIPAAAGLAVLAEPLISVLFQYGRFDVTATRMMAPVLVASAAGLPFLSFASLALRAFYARKDTVTPVIAALLSFGVNLGLSLALMGPLSIVGLAVAGSVASAVQAVYLQSRLARARGELAFHHLLPDVGKTLVAAAVMAVVVAAGWFGWAHVLPRTKIADATGLLALIGVGVGVHGAMAWWLRVEARDDVVALLARFRRKTG